MAPQVIVRDKEQKVANVAAKARAMLLRPLDTRYPASMVEAVLPRGFRYKGEMVMPVGIVIIGRMSYEGKGELVQVKFDRGVGPNGQEFELAGMAMDAKGNRPGIPGEIHGNARGRWARAMGLSAVANMAGVLTQKEALGTGRGTVIERKSSLPNALLFAASEASREEARRQMEAMGQREDYVTVPAGTPFILTLTASFKAIGP